MENKRSILIYSMQLAGSLMSKGHALIGISRNSKDSRKFVFTFYETDLLHETMDEYQLQRLQAKVKTKHERNKHEYA